MLASEEDVGEFFSSPLPHSRPCKQSSKLVLIFHFHCKLLGFLLFGWMVYRHFMLISISPKIRSMCMTVIFHSIHISYFCCLASLSIPPTYSNLYLSVILGKWPWTHHLISKHWVSICVMGQWHLTCRAVTKIDLRHNTFSVQQQDSAWNREDTQ